MSIVIKDARIINEGSIFEGDLLISGERIERIDDQIDSPNAREIVAEGRCLMPGIIDDQVHFREPGLTHKANIGTESKAAIAGGVTSFMEMPNTKPNAVTQEILQEKYDVAAKSSYANYSFFMGATNDNLEEVLKTNPQNVCGVKVFMGSSTGNMLVDNIASLEKLFAQCRMLIATHCEDEQTIRDNLARAIASGRELTAADHPIIRNVDGCLKSSNLAVSLARKHDTRLHVLHISTADELELFVNHIPLSEKRITAEVCVHHLYFDSRDYQNLGNKIKCNPAIKEPRHKVALLEALLDDRLDIIATDHAPHLREEKAKSYVDAPSGLPLVQHSLNMMLSFFQSGYISLEKIVEKMCHAPAVCFGLKDRGFIREGQFADLILMDPNGKTEIKKDDLHFKCGWSPLEGRTLPGAIETVFLNGQPVVHQGIHQGRGPAQRLQFG